MRTIEIEDMISAQKKANNEKSERYVALLCAVARIQDRAVRLYYAGLMDELFGKQRSFDHVEFQRKSILKAAELEYDNEGNIDIRESIEKLKNCN